MKLTITQKCHAIGSLFLLAATAVEITIFTYIFDINLFQGKSIMIVSTACAFNFAIWWVAIAYQAIKTHLKESEND